MKCCERPMLIVHPYVIIDVNTNAQSMAGVKNATKYTRERKLDKVYLGTVNAKKVFKIKYRLITDNMKTAQHCVQVQNDTTSKTIISCKIKKTA